MLPLFCKVFIRQFYSANTGFFLFFFFIFFGAVDGGNLIPYHLSIMRSLLDSPTTLLLVFACWFLYHLKCFGFAVKAIEQPQCNFLYNMQASSPIAQWVCCGIIYTVLYAPVLLYSILVAGVGFRSSHAGSALAILSFQILSLLFFTAALRYQLTHWIDKFRLPSIALPVQKRFLLFLFFHFFYSRKKLLLVLKFFSLLLLFIILVWNRGRYDNDSFLLFYLVILSAHAVVTCTAVQFMEKELLFARNLPISLFKRLLAFIVPYCLLLVPETIYILWQAESFPIEQRVAYAVNLVVSLSLLTAIQYSEAVSRNEYLKATFAVVFVSIFVLHAQAFWFWIGTQLVMTCVLFTSGYNNYERSVEE